jgi:Homing endonuclease associated repeat/HNH endonuclease
MKYELDRLLAYDRASLIAELQRVSGMTEAPTLTRTFFDANARVSSDTVIRRLGGWQAALTAAGLSERYSGRTVSDRMRSQPGRDLTEAELIGELQRVAALKYPAVLTRGDFGSEARVSYSSLERRFGSWAKALAAAGLDLSPRGRRHSDDDYFENLLEVWTRLGRQPKLRELDIPPSRITSGAYEAKWDTWRAALLAFLDRANADAVAAPSQPRSADPSTLSRTLRSAAEPRSRNVPLGVRYFVLRRDHFKCVLCGASPATMPTCALHVDHIDPVSKGGGNDHTNLRTLCERCNLGRGNAE